MIIIEYSDEETENIIENFLREHNFNHKIYRRVD